MKINRRKPTMERSDYDDFGDIIEITVKTHNGKKYDLSPDSETLSGTTFDSFHLYKKNGVLRYGNDENEILTPCDLAGVFLLADGFSFLYEYSGGSIWMSNFLCGTMSASQLVAKLENEGRISLPEALKSNDPNQYSREQMMEFFDIRLTKSETQRFMEFVSEVKSLEEIKAIDITGVYD